MKELKAVLISDVHLAPGEDWSNCIWKYTPNEELPGLLKQWAGIINDEIKPAVVFELGDRIIDVDRGDSAHFIENTISAMRFAMDSGVDMVETDVRMSSDGHLFLMHNKDLATCSDASGRLEDYTGDEIPKINLAGKGGAISEGEHPAPFEDFLELAAEYPDVILNIEFKDLPGRNGVSEEFAFEALDKAVAMLSGSGLESRVLINSFSATIVERVFRKCGNLFHYHTFYPWDNNIGMTIPCGLSFRFIYRE